MEMFVICTVQKSPRPGMAEVNTWSARLTPGPEVDREGLFRWVMEQGIPEHMRGGTVLFYSAEPLRLGSPESAASAPEPVGASS